MFGKIIISYCPENVNCDILLKSDKNPLTNSLIYDIICLVVYKNKNPNPERQMRLGKYDDYNENSSEKLYDRLYVCDEKSVKGAV